MFLFGRFYTWSQLFRNLVQWSMNASFHIVFSCQVDIFQILIFALRRLGKQCICQIMLVHVLKLWTWSCLAIYFKIHSVWHFLLFQLNFLDLRDQWKLLMLCLRVSVFLCDGLYWVLPIVFLFVPNSWSSSYCTQPWLRIFSVVLYRFSDLFKNILNLFLVLVNRKYAIIPNHFNEVESSSSWSWKRRNMLFIHIHFANAI